MSVPSNLLENIIKNRTGEVKDMLEKNQHCIPRRMSCSANPLKIQGVIFIQIRMVLIILDTWIFKNFLAGLLPYALKV